MKQAFTIAVLLFMAITAMAQVATVKKTAGFTGKYPIVREWNEDYSVAYAQTSDLQGCFILEDHASFIARSASLPPQHLITDFEIMNDTVYLCGYYDNPGSGKSAFVGLFGIDEMFHHGGGIQLVHIGNATSGGYTYYEQFTIPTRMDVFELDGVKHIVAVGDCELTPVPGQFTSSTIADMALSGNGWTGFMLFNKRHHEHYTDIVATRNYVIATARSADSNACYLKPFYKSANILATPLTLGYIHQVGQGIPTGKVLVDALECDSFAITYHYTYMGIGASTVKMFSISGGALSLLYSTNLVQSTTSSASASWEMRDIRYNNTNRNLFVLQDMQYPISSVLHSAVLEYNMANLGCLNTTISWLGQVRLNTLDQYRGAGFKAVGCYADDELCLYDKQSGLASICTSQEAKSYTNNTTSAHMVLSTMDEANDPILLHLTTHILDVQDIELNIDCQN